MPEARQGSLFVLEPPPGKPGQTVQAPRLPEDADARLAAIDTSRSILVQAPAGAGKTSLLTQRFLALLAEVEEPEQILAITFTRAATAEMRQRILTALESARNTPPSVGESQELRLARAALHHADACSWQLLEQPHRLDVQTIDSLCLRLAHAQPLLARLGGSLQPAENDRALYNTAARRTTALLGDASDPELAAALELLLLRRDNNLAEVERLLAEMLQNRSAWLGVLPLAPASHIDWTAVREQLEQPFLDAHARVLDALTAFSEAEPELLAEWIALARYAAGNLEQPILDDYDLSLLLESASADVFTGHAHWLALTAVFLKKEGEPRAAWNIRHGFPAPDKATAKQENERRKQHKDRIKACSASLQSLVSGPESLQQLLCQLRSLPAPGYTDDQWQTLRAAFLVLRRAAAELRFTFAEANRVDFVEIAQAAEQVLRDETTLRGLLESEQRRHLLIDEFQDTSRAQHRLVAELMREWQPGDGRSVFLVGDPLQSIYSFRQAEVALFHQTREHGLPCGPDPNEDSARHACHPLQLTHNFRAHQALVDALNSRLAQVFPPGHADRFVPATAWPRAAEIENSLELHTSFLDTDAGQTVTRDEETQAVLDILESELPRITSAEARGDSEYRVAVLVSARNHLAHITRALRDRRIPYRAVDLEPLAERQEVHDLHMLLRALLHPGERVAWLTVLRAPWCGLTLNDLHILAGSDDRRLLKRPVAELIETRAQLLSPDGRQRLGRTWQALRHALQTRYSEDNNTSLAAWLERAWTALGGPACVDANARNNADAFFCLLDELAPSGIEVLRGDFKLRLEKLCAAPDTRVSERFGIQLMTIHKAKGLGFEVVLVPGLDRRTRSGGSGLLAMLERTRAGSPFRSELLLAPIGSRETEADPTYAWVKSQTQLQIEEERKRLFYVACTRARTRLHLFATLKLCKGKVSKPAKGSLLAASGAAFTNEIEQRAAAFLSRENGLPAAGLQLAASAEPSAGDGYSVLERLPSGWSQADAQTGAATEAAGAQRPRKPLFSRNNSGSLLARARGNAVHAVLERLAHLFAAEPETANPSEWQQTLLRTAERALRAGGFTGPALHSAAAEIARTGITVAGSGTGRWLLYPHPGALAESTWQAWDEDGNLRTLRVDRSFRAGSTPGEPGDRCLWLIDYKTGAYAPEGWHTGDELLKDEWREQQKQQWRGQLEAYGTVLRQASGQGAESLRYGLFFPELLELIRWN